MNFQLTEDQIQAYVNGLSIREISDLSGFSTSAVNCRLTEAGVIRSRGEGTAMALKRGVNFGPASRLSECENGPHYAAKLSQQWLKKPLGVFI
tara:strand:+ start:6888 stop:7166 length:279 start_codon:yes stop_codon:yes gene_type:complete